MPSIEFLGYGSEEVDRMADIVRRETTDLDFAHEIVFVVYATEVRDIRGNRESYLRVCTRNEAKARVLMDRLRKHADVEYIKSTEFLPKDK